LFNDVQVWDVLDELTVCHIADAYNDPHKAALQIAEESIGNGSGDNISVIVVYLSRRDKLLRDAEVEEKT
jgi:serine/threonine protein phosphatase PrpC